MADRREHISLSKLDIQRPRYKRPGIGQLPERQNVEHGTRIREGITKIRREFEKLLTESPSVIEPVLVFRMGFDKNVSETELARSGLTLLDEEVDKHIIV